MNPTASDLGDQDGVGGRIFTHQSFFNNRMPATFDARLERKENQIPGNVDGGESESDTAF